jgi:hypothetical protein
LRGKRTIGERQTVLRLQTENGDSSCGTNGQTMLALETVPFQSFHDFREFRVDADNPTRTIPRTGIAVDTFFSIHSKIESHCSYSRERSIGFVIFYSFVV